MYAYICIYVHMYAAHILTYVRRMRVRICIYALSQYGQARSLVPMPSTSGTFLWPSTLARAHAIFQRVVHSVIGQVVNREYHEAHFQRVVHFVIGQVVNRVYHEPFANWEPASLVASLLRSPSWSESIVF